MKEPVPFILTGEDGVSLVVDERAKAALANISKPVVVVSVVGMYRTGKSFLLNRLMDRTDGFPLGATVEAKTKGIWMWVGDFPGDSSRALVLLDTEGLSDPEKGSKTHDAQIFTLAVLLSSILIYNTKGTIDASSLDGLHLATELTSHITTKTENTEETGADFSKFFPMLVWAVRDHHLELSVDGKEITSDQYLENCLTMKMSKRPQDVAYNNIRETIRDFFKDRKCFVFPLPTSMDNLQHLDKMALNQLDPEFIKAGDKFAEFMAKNSPSKMVGGKAITGGMYATLAETYVEAIVKGNVNIESAYDSMINMENSKSQQAAVASYQAEMAVIQLPVDMDTLNTANNNAQNTATEIFLKTAVNSHKNQEYFKNLTDQLATMFNELTQTNLQVSQQKCQDILESLYKPVEQRVASGDFTRKGGHQAYKEQVQEVETRYEAVEEREKGPCGHQALLHFRKNQIDPQMSSLLQSDKALTREEKKNEKLNMEVENRRKENEVLENQKQTLQKHQEDMKITHENNMQQQRDEIAKQHKIDMELLEKNRKNENEERERLVREGFKDQADLMNQQMLGTMKMMTDSQDRNAAMQAETMKLFAAQTKAMNDSNKTQMEAMTRASENRNRGGCSIM